MFSDLGSYLQSTITNLNDILFQDILLVESHKTLNYS